MLGGAANVIDNLCGSLRLSIDSCIVTKLHLLDVLVGIIVEEHGRACLSLEVNTVLVLSWHLKYLNPYLALLEDGLDLFSLPFLIRLIYLPLYIKVYLPCFVRYFEDLALILQLLRESSKKIVRLEEGKEGMVSALSLNIVLYS